LDQDRVFALCPMILHTSKEGMHCASAVLFHTLNLLSEMLIEKNENEVKIIQTQHKITNIAFDFT